MLDHRDAAETAIEIIASKKPVTDLVLCRYLQERRIDKGIADTYCHEVIFKFSNKETKHVAIGFKNSAGGYELRNPFFKLSSSPKYVTYITNKQQNSDTKTGIASNDFIASKALKQELKKDDKSFLHQPSIVSQNGDLKTNLNSVVKDDLTSTIKSLNQPKNDALKIDLKTGSRNNVAAENVVEKSTNKAVVKDVIDEQNDMQRIDFKSSLDTDIKNKIAVQNKASKQIQSIAVFEGFFDFLSYQTIHQNQQQLLTNFLILNSLSFFERSLLLMEKHDSIHLYLDQDTAGKKCLDIAFQSSPKYKDESHLYQGYKDLNDWVMHFGKLHQKQVLKVSNKNRLL